MEAAQRARGSFTEKDNLCGDALLGIVCRGHGELTELLRLSTIIPPAFASAAAAAEAAKKEPTASGSGYGYFTSLFGVATKNEKDEPDDNKYNSILFDFTYLRNPEKFENLIASTDTSTGTDMRALEAEFASTHRNTLADMYRLFGSIYTYYRDLQKFVTDLSAGKFLQCTVESVLIDTEGRQLLCEATYLYGMMLLLMERHIPGAVRERIVIAFLRYCGEAGDLSRFDEICTLVRCTNSAVATAGRTSSDLCEEKLFSRYPLPPTFIRSLIGCLLSDDIYVQSPIFPSFSHRTMRLAKQSSMLYVILYFQTSTLHVEKGTMREIVDKFFNNQWVVSLYNGMLVDVSEQWARFDAASLALGTWLQLPNMEVLYRMNAKSFGQCLCDLRTYLTRGVLTDNFFLDNIDGLFDCLRRCNVALRWRLLHHPKNTNTPAGAKPEKKGLDTKKEEIVSINDGNILTMMLLISRFEEKLKAIISHLIAEKSNIWEASRTKAAQRMMELSHYFSGEQALADVERNEPLMGWFASFADEIRSLSRGNGTPQVVIGKKIQFCIESLEDINEFDLSSQAKITLQSTKDVLLQMARMERITSETLGTIESISDMSYGQEAIESYVPAIHMSVKKDPSTVSYLHGLFLKLSSCIQTASFRLEQASSEQLDVVKAYHSSFIERLVRNTLAVVPSSIFSVLLQIADMKEKLCMIPSKIETESLRDIAQIDERYKLSLLTYEISVFAEGIFSMHTISVGRIEIKPREIFDRGLRKALCQHVSVILHRTLQFQFRGDVKPGAIVDFQSDSTRTFSLLISRLDGLKYALEQTQDYIGTSGLKLWDEEFSRIIAFNVEQESNKYMRNKVSSSLSCHQSADVPIPLFAPTDTEPLYVSFIGRVMSSLLKMTEPQATIFSLECNGWFLPDGTEACGSQMFHFLHRAVQVWGLVGLDMLLSFRVLNELQRFVKFYHSAVKSHGVLLEQIRDTFYPDWKTPHDPLKLFASATKKTEKLMTPVATCVRRVGQAQILRKMIRDELRLTTNVDAEQMQQSLAIANEVLLGIFDKRNSECSDSSPENSMGSYDHISEMFTGTGGSDPLLTIFLTIEPMEGLQVVLSMFVISHMESLKYDRDFGSLVRAKDEVPFDGWPLVAGMASILKQFHPSFAASFFASLSQFVRAGIQVSLTPKNKSSRKEEPQQLPVYITNTLIFMCQLCSLSGIDRSVLHEHIPEHLISLIPTNL